MKIRLIYINIILFLFFMSNVLFASEKSIHLDKFVINHKDKASLQRGAEVFMRNCLGCHGLKYVMYKGLAEGLGIVLSDNVVDKDYIKNNWIFNDDVNINDHIFSPISQKDAINWFGILPPDLSLVTRYRSSDWVYTYLKSFYEDTNKIWGVNNLIFPDVAMPHILNNIQGNQILSKNGEKPFLKLVKKGSLSDKDYDIVISDIVNFLSYVGDPVKEKRELIGIYVLLFLLCFAILSYFLKKEFWKNIK
ncbi:MAG: cytochrome c1 [Candidatus Azosocius agrarius]|nr:MAG: cytochrome c1 [Gammaproteobacteria bacterium]